MKNQILIFLFFLVGGTAYAQEKAPIIGDDYASLMAGDTISINVMENDWGMDGHTISILNVYQGEAGHATVDDSIVTIASHFYFEGVDTVRYVLKDEDNGLLSLPGKIVLTVSNGGRGLLEVNNISSLIQPFGLQFCDMGAGAYVPHFEAPKGSKRNTIFVYNLWLGGLDDNEGLHLAAERYRSNGNDYWNGPVSSEYFNQQILDYNRVWNFTRDDIEYHRQHWWEPYYVPSDAIESWPAHGNIELGQAENLASFNDRNGDGMYNWDKGDYPSIRGDQGIFFINNDDFGEHTESGGEKIKVEVHGQAYAFDCPEDSVFNNTQFMHYDIISRGELAYHNFYIAAYLDFDLGYAWDDYIGCDTLLEAIYAYNGDEYDEDDTLTGYVPTYGYRDRPPAQAMVYLNAPMSSAIAFSNYSGPSGDPSTAEEIYNTMQGLWKNGTPITVGGNGIGGTETTSYMYSGNPSNLEEWSEFSEGNDPQDRRTITATGPFNLEAGDTLQLDVAFVFARDYNGNQITSVDLLKERVQELRWYYNNDSTPCGKAWTNVPNSLPEINELKVYPNPATDYLFIDCGIKRKGAANYRIIDFAGKTIDNSTIPKRGKAINIAHLARGFYILEVSVDGEVLKEKFIKK